MVQRLHQDVALETEGPSLPCSDGDAMPWRRAKSAFIRFSIVQEANYGFASNPRALPTALSFLPNR